MPGTPLTVTGIVYSLSCTPVGHALLDFWQADYYGRYDNYGYTLRGHQYTDTMGRFSLTTIVPGLYPGRTRHIHVKVQAPYQRILTTQLYFPGEPRNNSDMLFAPELLMNVQATDREVRDVRLRPAGALAPAWAGFRRSRGIRHPAGAPARPAGTALCRFRPKTCGNATEP